MFTIGGREEKYFAKEMGVEVGMEIGRKIKDARAGANLTQEQAAEVLGVSRQTISNWENAKTYPDIVSVVKMSDLYKVSLDELLKGEKPKSAYLNYLEESTNLVRSRARLSKLLLILTYLVIWAAGLIVFWYFTDGSDAFGYSLTFLGGVLPVMTVGISIQIGRNDYWGRYKWLASIVFGVMYMLAEYLTFCAANMAAFGKINDPDYGMIVSGARIL